MASSPYEKLLELAHQRALNGKGGLAASIAEMCLASQSGLTERELTLAFEILRLLVDKVEVKIRRHIADYLADRKDVPADLIQFLANDAITVAYPIILHSELLQEEDLLKIVIEQSARHRQAVAIRPYISSDVTDKLVEFDEAEVLTTLICNETAKISDTSMQALVDRSLEIEAYREPLAHRKEMTPNLAKRMYVWVGDALRDYIVHNFQIDPDTVSDSLNHAASDTPDDTAPKPTATLSEIKSPAPEDNQDGGRALLRFLNTGDISAFESAFAGRLNLSVQAMGVILYDSTFEALAIAAKAAGIAPEVFSEILCHLSGVRPADDYRASKEYCDAMDYFSGLDDAGATDLLDKWRETPGEVRGG